MIDDALGRPDALGQPVDDLRDAARWLPLPHPGRLTEGGRESHQAIAERPRTGREQVSRLVDADGGPRTAAGLRHGGRSAPVSDTGELRTDRLVLQPLNMSDLSALLTHWTGPLVRQYLFDGAMLSSRQVSEIIVASQRDFAYAGFGMWALRAAARHAAIDSRLLGTALLGTAGLRRLAEDGEPGEVEIVYSLEPAGWGHGYAAEAAEAVLAYAFETLGLNRVVAEIDEGNAASEAVAGRLGMRPLNSIPGTQGTLSHYGVERADWPALMLQRGRA